jgi:hypothetical protein
VSVTMISLGWGKMFTSAPDTSSQLVSSDVPPFVFSSFLTLFYFCLSCLLLKSPACPPSRSFREGVGWALEFFASHARPASQPSVYVCYPWSSNRVGPCGCDLFQL